MSRPGEAAGGVRLRPASARGRVVTGGVRAVEAFSRANAIDRAWMGWGALRVLSHQAWAPGARRDEGRVANMERLLLVVAGALDVDAGTAGRHRVDAGGALWIGAGHGLEVGLANASSAAPLRLVELWLQPDRVNAPPAVAVRAPGAPAMASGDGDVAPGWDQMACGGSEGEAGPLPLRLNARLMTARIAPGASLDLPASGQRSWLEVLDGGVGLRVPGSDGPLALGQGDGIGWTRGDAGAPAAIAASGDAPALVLLLALPA